MFDFNFYLLIFRSRYYAILSRYRASLAIRLLQIIRKLVVAWKNVSEFQSSCFINFFVSGYIEDV